MPLRNFSQIPVYNTLLITFVKGEIYVENHYDDEVPKPAYPRSPLTEQELTQIKQQLLDSIYADIGKSAVKKILWVAGACLIALFAWLAGADHIRIGG